MKVLLTVDSLPPASRAGCQLYTYNLAQALRSEGHFVRVLCAERSTEFGTEERFLQGLPCTVVKAPFRETIFLDENARVEAVFCDLLTVSQPDVVHINHLLRLSVRIPRLSQARRIPVVFTLHDHWLQCSRLHLLQGDGSLCSGPTPAKCLTCCQDLYSRWRSWPGARQTRIGHAKDIVKGVLRRLVEEPSAHRGFQERSRVAADIVENTDLFVAPSRCMQEFMAGHGIPREKLVHCANGIPSQSVAFTHRRPRAGRLRFGYIGSITHHKGVPVLLEAFNGFREGELYIYGRPSPSRFQPYSHVLAQGNVRYMGELQEEAKAAALADLDALIVPSVCYENSPLVIQEAFLAGLPVVTSNIGGMAELVPDKVCGLQFRVGDAGDLREKLAELCRNPSELDRMRGNIPRVKAMDEHARELTGYYFRVMKQKQAVCQRAHAASTATHSVGGHP